MTTRHLYNPLPAGETELAVPADYLDKDFIKVYKRNHAVGLTQTTFIGTLLFEGADYTWTTNGTLHLTSAADGLTDYLVARQTQVTPMVEQRPGVFSSTLINLVVQQALHLAEEARDLVQGESELSLGTDLLSSSPTKGAGIVGYSQDEVYPVSTVGGVLNDLPLNPTHRPFYAQLAGVTNETASFNAGIASAKRDGRKFTWNGTALVTGPINIDNVEVEGAGLSKAKLKVVGNTDLFQINGSFVALRGFQVDNSERTGGDDLVFELGASGGSIEHRFKDILFTGSKGALREDWVGGAATEYRTWFEGVKWIGHSGPGIRHTRAFAYLYYDHDCLVEFLNGSSPHNVGFYYDGAGMPAGAGGVHLGLNVVGTNVAGQPSSDYRQIGFHIKNTAGVYFMPLVRAEALHGRALILDNVIGATFLGDFGAFQCGGKVDGVVETVPASVLIANSSTFYGPGGIKVNGRRVIGGGAAGCHGALIRSSDNIDIPFTAIECEGSGVKTQSANILTIPHLRSNLNGRYGIETDANGVVGIDGGLTAGNLLGNISFGGALHRARSVTINSGAKSDFDGAGTW